MIRFPFPHMEARTAAEIPQGPQWWYEPKWDGFRCLAFRGPRGVELQSKGGKPLTRYFPELVAALEALPDGRFVVDGEIVVVVGKGLSFDALLQRIHPAASRVRRLAEETPASLILFDLLQDADGAELAALPLEQRRARLEAFAARNLKARGPGSKRGAQRAKAGAARPRILLSPVASTPAQARRWLERAGSALDGLVAKLRAAPYLSGRRDGMVKIKFKRTADCVVGGFRLGTGSREVGSLLLGLYDEQGLLNHVGFTTTLHFPDRAALTRRLRAIAGPPGFTGSAPGGPSRWASERSTEWTPVAPKLVVEVEYDHFTGERFRHGTRFLRWRPDKEPRQCTVLQVRREAGAALLLLEPLARAARRAAR